MKIRITNGMGWYEGREGEVFEVHHTDYKDRMGERVYYIDSVKEPETRLVRESNCEVVGDFEEADQVNHPSHYTTGKFETIEMIEEITKGYNDGYQAYCVGNALKYLSRAPYKHGDPAEDLAKAKKYLEFAMDGK